MSADKESGEVKLAGADADGVVELVPDLFTLPLRVHQSSVYHTIVDAEDRLIVFIGMSDVSALCCAEIVKAVNSYADLKADLEIARAVRDTYADELPTRAEREMEMIKGICEENDRLRDALQELFDMVNAALSLRDALLISTTCATMRKVEAALVDDKKEG